MTPHDDEELRSLLHRHTPAPAPDLLERVLHTALAQPQRRPRSFRHWLAQAFARGLEDWSYGMSYKLATLALAVMLGVAMGQSGVVPYAQNHDTLLTAVVLGDEIWLEDGV